MAFEVDKFISANWQTRKLEISVPGLKDWFSENGKPLWKVRSLEGSEVAKAKHARERNTRLSANIEAISDALGGSKKKEKIRDGIVQLIGNVEADADTAWRTELLVLASVEPECDYHLAAVLHKAKPEEYYHITNEIIRLIGLGSEPEKLQPSGGTKKSKRR
jgi:hypothetical protein